MVSARELDTSEFVGLNDPPSASEIDEVLYPGATIEEAQRDVRPLAQRKTEYIVLYHPDRDNPSSTYIVPMNANERRMVVGRLLGKQKWVAGKQIRWNFPRPQVEARELPLRCFVQGCQRRGGFQSRVQVITHVQGKHTNEAPMYQRLIDALMEQIFLDISPEQYALYGLKPPEDEGLVGIEPRRQKKAAGELESMTNAELRQLAASRGVDVKDATNKGLLIKALQSKAE